MNSSPLIRASRLMPFMLALLLSACASPSPNSPPPVIGLKPQAGPLPQEIAQISEAPSSSFFEKVQSYLDSLQAWQLKVEAYLRDETKK